MNEGEGKTLREKVGGRWWRAGREEKRRMVVGLWLPALVTGGSFAGKWCATGGEERRKGGKRRLAAGVGRTR
ncbi:hypothetical protein HAX54_025850 [Datura stramonium]|uniref:Uncharacterized protein n=1 Tax=Datura stramonium TaxID=4076 RepID=A0ABS8S6Q5_DATST|nr:hypothetical protein [Datura stramonium]